MATKDILDFEDISQEDIESLPTENTKSQKFCGILYPEDLTQHYAITLLLQNKYKCVFITHDRDIDKDGKLKKAHVHFIIKFTNARYRYSVAEEMQIKPNYLQPLSSFNSYCTYMLHMHEPFKEQYQPQEVLGSLYNEFLQALNKADNETIKVQKILYYITNTYSTSRKDLLTWICNNGLYDTYRRGYSLFNDILKQKDGLL